MAILDSQPYGLYDKWAEFFKLKLTSLTAIGWKLNFVSSLSLIWVYVCLIEMSIKYIPFLRVQKEKFGLDHCLLLLGLPYIGFLSL